MINAMPPLGPLQNINARASNSRICKLSSAMVVSKMSQRHQAFDSISAPKNPPHTRFGAPLPSARNLDIELTDRYYVIMLFHNTLLVDVVPSSRAPPAVNNGRSRLISP